MFAIHSTARIPQPISQTHTQAAQNNQKQNCISHSLPFFFNFRAVSATNSLHSISREKQYANNPIRPGAQRTMASPQETAPELSICTVAVYAVRIRPTNNDNRPIQGSLASSRNRPEVKLQNRFIIFLLFGCISDTFPICHIGTYVRISTNCPIFIIQGQNCIFVVWVML